MKARIKGFDDPFKEIETLTMKGVNGTYFVDDVEFEQEPHQLNPEEEKLRQQTAIAAMQGFIAHGWDDSEYIVKRSIRVADALIEKLKGDKL